MKEDLREEIINASKGSITECIGEQEGKNERKKNIVLYNGRESQQQNPKER